MSSCYGWNTLPEVNIEPELKLKIVCRNMYPNQQFIL